MTDAAQYDPAKHHRQSIRLQRAVDDGRLLVMTPFVCDINRFSASRAAWCNQYALHLAADMIVVQVSEGGMRACLLADVPQGKPVIYSRMVPGGPFLPGRRSVS